MSRPIPPRGRAEGEHQPAHHDGGALRPRARLRWDLHCRVVDNYGDAGVCWRLAADLASRGDAIRLWIDDASPLAWMAPHGATGVEVRHWGEAAGEVEPGDVVVEAFACDPPPAFVRRMQRQRPPVWINLEYLSAQDYVARSHGLRSPVGHGPGAGLHKWFYFPGFTGRTGGLLREADLPPPRANAADEPLPASLSGTAAERQSGERRVSLFGYENASLASLLDALATQPTLLLTAPGAATGQVAAALAGARARPALRWQPLPWLTQPDYDALLRACDLNLVRGEDSFVRAQWAGRPFVWQAYPQSDGAQAEKVEAFLALHLHDAPRRLADRLGELWRVWNGSMPPGPRLDLPDCAAGGDWAAHALAWRASLGRQSDLGTRLRAFALAKLADHDREAG